MTDTKELGRYGETQAERYLRRLGYRTVEKNFSCRFGEIDLIVCDRQYIVFVEVKLRKNADFAEAREFVTHAKQQRIITAASLWLSRHETELQPRFDVVEVYAPGGLFGRPEIHHIEDAFS